MITNDQGGPVGNTDKRISFQSGTFNFGAATTGVPEPTTVVTTAVGLAGLLFVAGRKRRQ